MMERRDKDNTVVIRIDGFSQFGVVLNFLEIYGCRNTIESVTDYEYI